MATPHNSAKKGDFASIVLMPGDPERGRYIAERFMLKPKLVNNVRGAQGYTGETMTGIPFSVMASGMGQPSIAIHARELFTEYGVEAIIRVGSAGALRSDLPLRSIVVAESGCTPSNILSNYGLPDGFCPTASLDLLHEAIKLSELFPDDIISFGRVLATDFFYTPARETLKWAEEGAGKGAIAVDMETAVLYAEAANQGTQALTLNAVSDNLVTGESLPAHERAVSFNRLIQFAIALINQGVR